MVNKSYFKIEEIIALPALFHPSISDNGQKIAFIKRLANWDKNSYQFYVWIHENGRSYPITSGNTESFFPVWSPNSRTLAYLVAKEEGGEKKQRLFIKPDGEAEGLQISEEQESISYFKWSPDGKGFFYLALTPESKTLKTRKELYGSFEYIDRDYRYNCLYFLSLNQGLEKHTSSFALPKDLRSIEYEPHKSNEGDEQENLAVPLTEGQRLHIYEFDISPDGKTIVFGAAPSPNLEELENIDIYLLDVHSKEIQKLATSHPGGKRHILFSPDGSKICYIYHRDAKWFLNQTLAILNLESGEITYPDIPIDESICPIRWTEKGIAIQWQDRVNSYVGLINEQENVTPLVQGDDCHVLVADISRNGEYVAYLQGTSKQRPELYFNHQRLTHESLVLENRFLAQKQLVRWLSMDGTEIEGILSMPVDFDRTKQYPLLVIVHGGPKSTSLPHPTMNGAYPIESFVEKGFITLEPNYRGSAGYGEAFRQLNYRDLGKGDYLDIISGVDFLISQGFVDGENVGVMGWSQGGYIAAFCATYSNRFKAASVGAGISNWMTYYVSTDIHPFTRHYLGDTPWNDEEIYKKTSPMTYIKSACTPTLIQHGDADRRVPVANAYELYQGLRDMGVETELVIFKGMGHWTDKPGIVRAIAKQNLAWFCHYLLGESKEELYLQHCSTE
ncbi:MAG TPA: S9 family peptidase [Cyanophyceae cyanobacterium]